MRLKKIIQRQMLATLIVVLGSFSFAWCLPEGERVVSGDATFDRSSPNALNIQTPSDKLIVNYNSFSIAKPESVNFVQPSGNSVVLNRVEGSDPSAIFGSLTANGKIFLVNPNGIVFGPDSQVNAAGLVASTLDISNDNFLKGNYIFFKSKENAFILNQGNINIRNGGYACLLSQAVDNQAIIQADLGTIALAAGEKMTLALDDLSDISVVVDEAVKSKVIGPDGEAITSALKNSGTITANGGKVLLTAKVLNNVFDYAINNCGIIQANTLAENNGVIELVASGAPVINTGTLRASKIDISAKDTDFINKGKIIASKAESAITDGNILVKAFNIYQGGFMSADDLISLEAVDTVETILKDNPVTLAVNPLAQMNPGVVIQAPRVQIFGKRFGSNSAPLNIDSGLTYISRTQGNIDIMESLGIGTSIMLRGPPDGFGAIIYNKDTHLNLEAQDGSISEAQGVTISADSLSLIANQNIDIYGALKAANVVLDSINGNTILYLGSLIDVSSSEGVGGIVQILGQRVGLFGAQINASGISGGGTILIGGDYQGSGTLQRALRTYISSDSIINADAITNGNGGKVIVWSDEATWFYGSISARGGVNAGNGGLVEVSGGELIFDGRVDVGVTNGVAGSILLDPKYLEVKNTGGSDYTGVNNLFANNSTGNTIITATSINALTGAIILQANTDVTITDAITTLAGATSLTIQAGRSVIINNNIDTSAGNDPISITANDSNAPANRDSGAGNITLAATRSIKAGSGTVTLTIGTSTSGNFSPGSIQIASAASPAIGAGTISLNGNVQLQANTTLNSSAGTGGINITGTINSDATARNLTLTAGTADIAIGGAIGATTALSSLTITGNDISLDDIGGANAGVTGTTSVTAANNGGDTGSITFNGTIYKANQQTYNAGAANTIALGGGGATTFTSSGDTITFTGLVDGGVDVVLAAGTGDTTFNNAVGSITPIGDGTGAALIINSTGTTSFESTLDTASGITQANGAGTVTFRGDMDIQAGNTVTTFNANVVLDGLTFASDDDITFGNATSDQLNLTGAAATIDISAAGANVTFNSKIDGNQDLTVNSGSGTTTFEGVTGGITPLASITTDAGGTTNIGANLSTQGGTMTFNDPVVLTANVILTDTGSGITFDQTVDGAFNLTMDVSGTTTFDAAVGSGTPIGTSTGAALTINSTGTTNFNSTLKTVSGITQANGAGLIIFKEDVLVGAGDTASTFNANVRLSGMIFAANNAVTFGNSSSDNLRLFADAVTIRTLGGAGSTLTVNARTDGDTDLTLDTSGAAIFNAQVGDGTPIGDGIGAAITINSTGSTTFVRNVTTASGIVQGVGAGTVTFKRDITVNGGNIDNNFNENVVLDGLTFTSAKNITFGDSTSDQLNLTSSAVIIDTSVSGANVTFNSKIDGNQDLTVNSGLGTTTFNGIVGGVTKLASITTDAGGTTNIGADLSAQGGTMTFNDPVVLTADVTLTDIGTTGITFNQTVDSDAVVSPRSLTVNDSGTTILNAAVGGIAPLLNLTINTSNDLDLAYNITATNDIWLKSSAGAINQTAGAITATGLRFDAAGAVTLDQLVNDIDNLAGQTTAAGDIKFKDANDLTIDTVQGLSGINAFSGSIMLNTLNGFLKLSKAVNAGVESVILGTAEAAEITSAGITLAADVTGATVDFNSADDIIQSSGGIIATDLKLQAAGPIDLNSDTNDVDTLTATTTNSDISVKNSNGLALNAINAGTGNVTLTLLGGAITDNNGISNNIIANTLNMVASTGIGSDDALETQVNILNARNTASGDINIDNTGSLDLEKVQNDAGSVSIISSGSVNGLGAGTHLIADSDSMISVPAGTIGLTTVLDYQIINGKLILDIGGAVGLISGRLTSPATTEPIFIPASLFPVYPRGSVYFNGSRIWPSVSTFLNSQANSSLVVQFVLPYTDQLNLLQLNSFDALTGGLVYYYHPLVEMDMSGLDEFILEEWAYEFIEGNLSMVGHDGILYILDQAKKKKNKK